MGKRNRGKVINQLPSSVRGTCPVCTKTGIKLLYTNKTDSNKTINVCKYCRIRNK
jgi:hypothetical protein